MPRLLPCALTVFFGWLVTTSVNAQVDGTRSPALRDNIVTDRSFGISFLEAGQPIASTKNGYTMSLESPTGAVRQATAAITVLPRPTVDLPGSFGGILYLDDPNAKSLLADVVRIDTVNINGLQFRREIWAVYAGMGAWEGVINCYAFHNYQYYSLRLQADISAGRPGEFVDGEQTSAETLRSRIADVLSDPRESVVQQFNALVSSFRVSQ